ncbi:MAG: putative DNA-binding domain-containing protein [Steroidobacteraceae bacterium]
MSALAEFQSNFSAALLNPQAGLRAQLGVGFAVYQNTVSKGLMDVLRANYPTVERLVGSEWFDAAALLYAREHLPEQPALALYGASFPAFLDNFSAIHELPYLPFVARLDRLWTEAHFAGDSGVLCAADLHGLSMTQLHDVHLRLHPAVRMAWVPHSAVHIWQANRPPAVAPDELQVDDSEQGVLLVRPAGQINSILLNRAGYDFLQHLANKMTLGEAAIAVLERHADSDIAALLASFIAAGAFADDFTESATGAST